MIIEDDSSLRRHPPLRPKENVLVDAIRLSIEMANHAYSRLRSSAHTVSLSQKRKEVLPKHIFTPIFLDAWSIIDSVHRLRRLLQSVLLRKKAEVRGFLAATKSITDLRNAVQHIDEEIENLADSNLPTWGALAWMFGNLPTDNRAWCFVMVPGSVREGREHLFLKPEGDIRLPVDRLTLTAHGIEVSLSAVIDSVERLTRILEDDIKKQSSDLPSNEIDLLLSLEIPWGDDNKSHEQVRQNKATLSIPETAQAAIIQYEIEPPAGKVLLYKTPHDQSPVTIEGPGGELIISLSEPRTLYYEMLIGVESFRLRTAGYQLDLSPVSEDSI
jgi:hypothetical protein